MSRPIEFTGYYPGAVGQSINLHMAYYAPAWGFDESFEAKLAREMGEFLTRWDPTRDLFLAARSSRDGALLGTVTVDAALVKTEGAHLRWFIVSESARGSGLGTELMRRVDAYLTKNRFWRTYLTTFPGLDAARALYERFGFRLAAEEAVDPWKGSVGMQRFERRDGRHSA